MKKNTRAARLGIALAAALALGACSSGGGGSTAEGDQSPTSRSIKVDGEGMKLNDYGGAALAIGEPKKGGSLKIGMASPIDTLDPTAALTPSGQGVAFAVYEPLTKVAPTGEVVPELAESLESEDGKVWTLKLRKDITFTDGTPYNADAVLAHLKRYQSPQTTARDAAQAKQITNTRKVDDLTVEITIAQPTLDFPMSLAGGMGMVPSPKAVKESGKSFGQKPVGAGPYKVTSFKPGGDLVLERNTDYHDNQYPYLDKLTLVTAADTQARLSALEAGSLDLATTTAPGDLKGAEDAGLTVLEQPMFTYNYLTLNLSKAPFDDPAMRKAVIQAIDTKALSTAAFDGVAQPMTGWFVPNHPDYKEVDYPTFDVEAAKAAVTQYKEDGGDTKLEIQVSSDPESARTVAVIQQMLKDAGFDVKVATLDQPTMTVNVASGKYQSSYRFLGLTLGASRDMVTRFKTGSPGTVAHAGDPALDKTLAELAMTPVDERKELYGTAQDQLAEWMPSVPLVQQVGAWVAGEKVGGFPGYQGEQTIEMARLKYIWAK